MKQGHVLVTPILLQDSLLTRVRHVPDAQDWLEQNNNPQKIFEAGWLHVTWIRFINIFNYSFSQSTFILHINKAFVFI